MFVAVASGSTTAAYSTDGVNWTRTTMPANLFWSSVCYGNDKFVAVVGTTETPDTSNVVAYSTDGVNWSSGRLPASRKWTSVCYGDGKFVAVAYNSNVPAYLKDYFDEWA